MEEVNDIQSQLNPTQVHSVILPKSESEILQALNKAKELDLAISIAGGRHSMGGQQFGTGTMLLDLSEFKSVVHFDCESGLVTVQSGIMWPELIDYLHTEQTDSSQSWAVRQKQTGVDRVSIGGSLSTNIHGRGLKFPPLISDIESFSLINHAGQTLVCSREKNRELFSLAIGGYGLFGIVTHVTLRLIPRQIVKRRVEIIAVKNLLHNVEAAIEEGFVYGDCQYSVNLGADEEFHPGVFSCYKPVDEDIPVPENSKHMSSSDWAALYRMVRTDKEQAFSKYEQYYLGTSGQVYWSDSHQLSNVIEGYIEAVGEAKETEMITEVYVTKENLIPFMKAVRQDFVQHKVDMTYGTIRFVEPDTESFLAWATERCVCIVCNLHVAHTPAGTQKAKEDFRRIIDRVIEYNGRFYLTYHRWATRQQVETCYPQFPEFLKLKLKYDPNERFQSDWYRHYVKLFR